MLTSKAIPEAEVKPLHHIEVSTPVRRMTPKDLQLCVDLRWGYIKYPCIVEPKVDGFRCLVTVDEGGHVAALSRSGASWQPIAMALEEDFSRFPGYWFDGEIQIGGSWGATNAASNRGWVFKRDELRFFCFAWSTMNDLTPWPHYGWSGAVKFSTQHLAYSRADVEAYYDQYLKAGYEGVVVKNLDAPYAAGRTGNWQRLKPCMTEDVPQPDGTIHEVFRGEVVRVRTE